MKLIVSDHARKAMERRNISMGSVRKSLHNGLWYTDGKYKDGIFRFKAIHNGVVAVIQDCADGYLLITAFFDKDGVFGC